MTGFVVTQDEAGLFAVSAAFGVGFSALIPAYVLAVREYFPAREASWRVPVVLLLSGSGMATGTWLAGALYDYFGFYAPAFAAGVAFNVANFILIATLVLRRRVFMRATRPFALRGARRARFPRLRQAPLKILSSSMPNHLEGLTHVVQTFRPAALHAAGRHSCCHSIGAIDEIRAQSAPTVIAGSGDVTPIIDLYRKLLGEPNNGNADGTQSGGRREINWDGVPDERAAPNMLPGDIFRNRGAILQTPGKGVQVSAKAKNPTNTRPNFAHINPTYEKIFKPFSGERMFSPVGSNVVNLTFVVPGTNTPAVVKGFGAVYIDTDLPHTSFQYFDQNGRSLGKFPVPAMNEGFTFLGVIFDKPVVARVRDRIRHDGARAERRSAARTRRFGDGRLHLWRAAGDEVGAVPIADNGGRPSHHYSGLMPAFLMIGHHLSTSALCQTPSACGVC